MKPTLLTAPSYVSRTTQALPAVAALGILLVASQPVSARTPGNVSTSTDYTQSISHPHPFGGSSVVEAGCPKGYRESIWWAMGRCPNTFVDNNMLHEHSIINSKVASVGGKAWATYDDYAMVYGASDLGIRVQEGSSLREDAAHAYQNGFIYRNALQVPIKNPFDIENYNSGAQNQWCPAGTAPSGSLEGYPQTSDPGADPSSPDYEECEPRWLRQSKDPDFVWDETNQVFYVAFVERYFENPGSVELATRTFSPSLTITGASSQFWTEWKLYVAKFDPYAQAGSRVSFLTNGASDFGQLNAYPDSSIVQHARSPRIALLGAGTPVVTWTEEYGTPYQDAHAAVYMNGTWDRLGGSYGIGPYLSCTHEVFAADSTSGKAFSGTQLYDTQYKRLSNIGYASDVDAVSDGTHQKAVFAVANYTGGACNVVALEYDLSTDYLRYLGPSAGAGLATTGTYSSTGEFFNPRVAISGSDVFVAAVKAGKTGIAPAYQVADGGRVYLWRAALGGTSWTQIKRQSNGYNWNTSSKFVGLAARPQDSAFAFEGGSGRVPIGHKVTLIADDYLNHVSRYDGLILNGAGVATEYNYAFDGFVDQDGEGNSIAYRELAYPVDVTFLDTNPSQVMTSHSQYLNTHRKDDTGVMVRTGGVVDPSTVDIPWLDATGGGATATNIAWNYTMGYKFTVSQSVELTVLCGNFTGTKAVKIWQDNVLIRTEQITGTTNTWTCKSVPPLSLPYGKQYIVAVVLGGSGGSYKSASGVFPVTSGPVTISGSTYGLGDVLPTANVTSFMYGQVDIGVR